ncbi:Vacuolar H+-ATPase V0 sector, subunit d [Trachipleistophora hominis]|uniref:Vacuolar H+-ATPase V0 sector, subunit d n=1 Tax=Trachipleistophora hominis TaxID=72359 RepID=L7JWN1_TRAHO|nr:Vacuolar H+-ATPase V0 sector, subunit d [Trachipleistophora hominis]
MQNEYKENDDYGYILAEIHGRQSRILTSSEYKALLQSDNIDDVIVKLQGTTYSKYLSDSMEKSKVNLILSLERAFKHEFNEIYERSTGCLRVLLTFFLESYKIESFIYRVSNPEEPEEELGFFVELNTLKFSNDMREVKKFVIDETFLSRYFDRINVENSIEKNNFQIIKRMLMKYHIEDFYGRINGDMGFMRTVLEVMGSIQIIEIVLNTMHTNITADNRKKLFPDVNDLDARTIHSLAECNTIDDLKAILGKTSYKETILSKDLLNGLQFHVLMVYYRSFSVFNDLSCVFCYLKLKEQEIKNICWIVEFLGEDEKDVMENIYCVN